MFFILVLIFAGIIITTGALILSLNINLLVDIPSLYQYNFLKNDKYFTKILLENEFGNYKTGYDKIAGYNGIIQPNSKIYIGEVNLNNGGEFITTGNSFISFILIDKNGNKFKLNNGNKIFLNKGFYKIYILNTTSNFANVGFYVSGDFLKNINPVNYNSGTFLLEIISKVKFSNSIFTDSYYLPTSIIEFRSIYNFTGNNWEKYNIIHFFASGIDEKSFFYFSGIKNLNISKDVIIGTTLITGCNKQIQGIYYDKKNRIYLPIDEDTLIYIKSKGYYNNISLSGGWYLNCFGYDASSIFGNLEVYSGSDLLNVLYVGRKYDFSGNNKIDITGDTLQIINYFGNNYLNGFFYDTNLGVGYIGGKFFNKNIFLNLIDYTNLKSISSSISGFFYDKVEFISNIGGFVLRKLYY